MKKYLFPALALGLVLTSCQSDEPFAPGEGGEKQVTFTLNVPGELGTRADSGNKSGVGGLSNNAGELSYTLVLNADGDQRKFTKTGAGSVVFNPTVVLGREYTVTAYAHFSDEAWDGEEAIDITKHFNDETKDAYFNKEKITFQLNETNKQITLKRPFGKLRLLATDYTAAGNELNTVVKNVKITYNDAQTAKFDVFDSEFEFEGNYVNADAKTFGYYAAEEDGAMPIFADYVPANPGDNMVDFTVEVTYTNDEKYSRTFNDIPVKRNALTTLKGNFFTAEAEIKVEVKDAFEGQIPGNAEEQLRMVAAMGGEVTLTDNVELDAPLNVQANMTLNLNGKTITTTLEQEGRHHYAIFNNANLVLEGEGAIEARGIKNFGEMTVNGNVAIKNIDSNGGAAIWNEGKVTINNGTFISSEGAGANTYGAALNTRSGGEAVVNGGTFEAYSQLTYAIVNEGKTTINNATVKGKHGAVAGAESNDQTTINGGSFELMGVSGQSDHCAYFVSVIRGGVFSRNEADTTAGDSVFWESKIAAGYKAIEKDGKYYVVPAEVVVVTTAKELQEALANSNISTIMLGKGTFEIELYNDNLARESLTIIGTEGTKVEFANQQVRLVLFKNFTIKNCEILHMSTKSWGMLVFSTGDEADGDYTVENCLFNGVGTQGIYINETTAGATYNVKNCTFKGDFGSEGAVVIQNNVNFTVNVTGCTFNNVTDNKIYVKYQNQDFDLNTDVPVSEIGYGK